jgi:RNA polymerase sigma factor (sigma-70 family)
MPVWSIMPRGYNGFEGGDLGPAAIRAAMTTPAAAIVDDARRERPALLKLARRHSLCAADAEDAVQRALEIMLRRLERIDPATGLSWLRTVVKHEAMAVRSARLRLVGSAEVDMDAREATHLPGPEERAAARERAHRSLAALATLKPAESRALVLQATGRSYAEIGAETGWTQTKVNRALTEGRAAFHARLADLDAGAACETVLAQLPALARGRAAADEAIALRAHLRACPACRARLRDLRRRAA